MREYHELKKRIERLERMLNSIRNPKASTRRQPRLAVTHDDSSTTYPTSGAVFPIRFVDGEFAKEDDGTVTYNARHDDVQTWVCNAAGFYLAPGIEIEVYEDRGLGDSDKGIYWTHIEPCYIAKTKTSAVSAADSDGPGSGNVVLQELDGSDHYTAIQADGADLEIEVWNMAEEDSGTEVFVQLKPIYPTGKLFIDWEACDE